MGNKQYKKGNKNFNKNKYTTKVNVFEKKEDLGKLGNKDKDKHRYKFNILFIGESGIGTKTSLIKRIIEGKFRQIKEYKEKCEHLFLEKDNKEIILYLIDTKGKKEIIIVSDDYFSNADCIIMGYDVTNKQSFK